MNKIRSDVLKIALNLLSRRPYFSFELEKKLFEKGFEQKEVKEAIKELIKSLLISDEERFKALIEYFQSSKKFGYYKIRFELIRKGASKEIVDEMLERYYSKELEESIQKELIIKKKGKLKDEENYKTEQKIYAYLKRRGF